MIMSFLTDNNISASIAIGLLSYVEVRTALLEKKEIAILDVREEAPFAEAHPLFAANFPLSRLETDVHNRLPNRSVTIAVYDDGEDLAELAAYKLVAFGYTNVNYLVGGLKGWEQAGGELFRDVNSASKAFGELVEAKRHTPSLSAPEVKSLIDSNEDIVILDARRFDEYNTMSIPTSTSVPGAELVLRVKELAPNPKTKVIVNCAGRTRSIIGTQSLVNAGIPNPVYALRNGTIGWTLAGQELEHGQKRINNGVSAQNKEQALAASREVASKARVKRTNRELLKHSLKQRNRTWYFFDVRSPEEYAKGHLPGFLSAPGGQLVQETDHFAPVRGAAIVLFDNQEVRANMTASWLAQMAWEVYVLDYINEAELVETGIPSANLPPLPKLKDGQSITAATLQNWLSANESVTVLDLATAVAYQKDHIPGAWYVLRSQLGTALKGLPQSDKYVLTSPDGVQALFTVPELEQLTSAQVYVLEGGNKAWFAEFGFSSEQPDSHFASPQIDRYRRPYEGTNNTAEAMQAYLDWEYGLVDQLDSDGTHGFYVI